MTQKVSGVWGSNAKNGRESEPVPPKPISDKEKMAIKAAFDRALRNQLKRSREQ